MTTIIQRPAAEEASAQLVTAKPDHVPLSPEQLENRNKIDAEVGEHLAFVRQVAEMLQEPSFYHVHLVIQKLGKQRVIALLKETLAIEQSGGMKTNDGGRRRTPGGVFFWLAKQQYGEEIVLLLRPTWQKRWAEKKQQAASLSHE